MARYRRTNRSIGFTHTFFRGVRKTPIFTSDDERRGFLRLLDKKCTEYDVRLVDFTLMDNHVHLLPFATGNSLSRAMRDVLGIYGRDFNFRHALSGSYLEDRYRAYPIRSRSWLLRTSKYVQMNPVAAGILSDPWKYPWSSASAYRYGTNGMKSLDTSLLLGQLGEDKALQRQKYLANMQKALRDSSSGAGYLSMAVQEGRTRGWSAEEVTAGLERALGIRDLAITTALRCKEVGDDQNLTVNRLWAYFGYEWNAAKSWLLSLPMGVSPGRVRQYVVEARALISSDPSFNRLAKAMRSSQIPD